ncbi:hypothetical protein EKH57_07110 [Halorubrum sp. BOL3-1]|uniref:zinc-ribbon domain-containing protein n=1 Tax=Halorubrum sp. BOL3-1 TaxID=2497325 RepID=UPI0010052698|nr:zinc-ribbon domain-containing protein [Halorubrum sp. BOL3-1]QAU12509.1 hypothetical protein EKH57_07110 [Halorubrum sp. BOL3-1]
MSDEEKKSLREQLEDNLEQQQDKNQTEQKKPKAKNKNNRVESQKSFSQKIEEFQNGEREENPWENVPKWKVFGGIIGIVLSLFFSIIFLLDGHLGLSGIFMMLPVILPLILTETGRHFLKTLSEELEELDQTQHKSTQSKPKRICSDCGWQNPQENSFCHDCGSKLGKSG